MKVLCKIPEFDNVVRFSNSVYRFSKVEGVDGLVCDVEDDAAIEFMLSSGPEFSILDPKVAAEVTERDEEKEVEIRRGNEGAARREYSMMTLDELQEAYRMRYGKAAHPATKHETLVEKLCKSALSE